MTTKIDLRTAKRKVNLAEYIKRNTTSVEKRIGNSVFLIPCPVCGSSNHHFSVDKKKHLYYSFSGCINGGSIIDYMVNVENHTISEAIKKTIELAK